MPWKLAFAKFLDMLKDKRVEADTRTLEILRTLELRSSNVIKDAFLNSYGANIVQYTSKSSKKGVILSVEDSDDSSSDSEATEADVLVPWIDYGRRELLKDSSCDRFKTILSGILTGGPDSTSPCHSASHTILAGVLSHAFRKKPRKDFKFSKPKSANLIVLYFGLKRLRDTWNKALIVQDSRLHLCVSYGKLVKITNRIIDNNQLLLRNFDSVSMPANCIEGRYTVVYFSRIFNESFIDLS